MSHLKAQKIDATTGKLMKAIVLYAVPLILGTLVQNCFNAIDLIVLGNMADSNAVASVGATSTIVSLLVNSFIGIVGGSKIILAHLFGARNSAQIKKTVDTAMLTAVGLGIIVAVIGVPLAPKILQITNCPEDCFAGAVEYMRIYVAAAPAILLYNFGSAVLTSSGDSQRPLYYIIISGLVNAVLNIVLCLILPQKVVAVAVSTAVSQLVGALLVIQRLCRMEGDGKIVLQRLRFDSGALKQIMIQGIPLAINSAIYPFANLQIQSAINTFGVSAIAGNSACGTLEGVPGAFSGSFASTATVFIGQNLGAGKKKRAKKSFLYCLVTSCAVGIVFGVCIYLTGRFWLSFFLPNDPVGIDYGMIRMFYVLLFYPVACANGVLSAAIQTHGYAVYTSICTIVCVCGFRLIWMWFLYPLFESFAMLMACFLVSWLLLLGCNIVGYFIFCHRQKEDTAAMPG